jgi:2-phospho-L-lactate transferase/gluconeogenesis factor (CofD/UPF0052 family)
MLELGYDVSVTTIANFYKNFSKRIFIDPSDKNDSDKLIELGFEVHSTDLIMNNTQSKNTLAKEIINYLELK